MDGTESYLKNQEKQLIYRMHQLHQVSHSISMTGTGPVHNYGNSRMRGTDIIT